MAKRIQLRRGTTAETNAFTGAVGEVTVDTNKKTIVVHDGTTVGGTVLAKVSEVPSLVPQATVSVAGKAKIATTAIAQAGTNDTDFLTPKKLRDALNATGEAPVIACRALAIGNSDKPVPTIIRSLNISTVTKLDYLNFSFTFTSPMPDANYIVIGIGSDQLTNSLGIGSVFTDYDKTVNGFKLRYILSYYASKEDPYSYKVVVL